jgi:hypothetical protein
VKSGIAKAQLEAETKREEIRGDKHEDDKRVITDTEGKRPEQIAEPRLARRFHGSIGLSAIRISRDAGQIADEVVQHLTKLPGANVEVTIEIQAEIQKPLQKAWSRTVSKNSRTLKFRTFGFEES